MLAGSSAKVNPYTQNCKKWETLIGAATFCLAKDMPIYSVEKPGPQYLLKEFEPQYLLPSHKHTQCATHAGAYFTSVCFSFCLLMVSQVLTFSSTSAQIRHSLS